MKVNQQIQLDFMEHARQFITKQIKTKDCDISLTFQLDPVQPVSKQSLPEDAAFFIRYSMIKKRNIAFCNVLTVNICPDYPFDVVIVQHFNQIALKSLTNEPNLKISIPFASACDARQTALLLNFLVRYHRQLHPALYKKYPHNEFCVKFDYLQALSKAFVSDANMQPADDFEEFANICAICEAQVLPNVDVDFENIEEFETAAKAVDVEGPRVLVLQLNELKDMLKGCIFPDNPADFALNDVISTIQQVNKFAQINKTPETVQFFMMLEEAISTYCEMETMTSPKMSQLGDVTDQEDIEDMKSHQLKELFGGLFGIQDIGDQTEDEMILRLQREIDQENSQKIQSVQPKQAQPIPEPVKQPIQQAVVQQCANDLLDDLL